MIPTGPDANLAERRFDNPEQREAFMHGRTQERLRQAVESLRRIVTTCTTQRRRGANKLLEIEVEATATLRRLSATTGGVIDDMEPLSRIPRQEDQPCKSK